MKRYCMMASRIRQNFVLLVCILGLAGAFVGQSTLTSKRTTSLSAEGGKETLVFKTGIEFSSEPLGGVEKDQVADFFRKDNTRDLLISAGGARPVKELSLTSEWMATWAESCSHFESDNLPNDDECVLTVDSFVQFPGMKLTTTVLSGVKEIEMNGMPAYELHLLAEKRQTSGAPPVVWLFNKLTGAGEKKRGEFIPASGYAMSLVTVNEKNGDFVFNFDSKFEMKVEFPSVLLKILPSSKDKMEEQGSAAVLKAISKDVKTSMETTRAEFLKWQTETVTV